MNSTIHQTSSGTSAISTVSSALTMNAESLFSNQLASALSTLSSSTLTSALISDSQYFEDSISPATIRQYLTAATSSNSGDPNLLRGMKWLLASMSKGRNVSDFFPHVVKLVGTQNLEIRKMVYTYLVHYANFDSNCRELALLSINAFQRGLTDGDSAWIRASALRVLTSIQVSDVLQIQILGVKKCIHDPSPYVRKCAVNALCKLHPKIPPHMENMKRNLIDDCWVELIQNEASVMVLSSCVITFAEICPERLELLHPVYRKLCHLLADLDEWGQIVTMEVLSRYCRKFFRKPVAVGRADIIDSQRTIKRNMGSSTSVSTHLGGGRDPRTQTRPSPSTAAPNKIKRRVVKKGFYSDEEDVSTEEDVYVSPNTGRTHSSLASALREELLIGNASAHMTQDSTTRVSGQTLAIEEDEDDHAALDPDHKMLLQCSLPLLKSRNSGVVLAVCSLQYYCGVASVRIRSAIGKALVRIYHDRREIQYIVLRSIKALVYECPSAFTPFLSDFFVKAMDPSFTRLIKLDILTALALEPKAIDAVLNELRTYISHEDKAFVCASIQAVGRIVEIARVVYDRDGQRSGNLQKARRGSNDIALNCLHGLITLTECSENVIVVEECVKVMQIILSILFSVGSTKEYNAEETVNDPNNIQIMAVRKFVMLAIRSLTNILEKSEGEQEEDKVQSKGNQEYLALMERTIILPSKAIAPAIWILSEWLTKARPMTLSTVSNKDQCHTLLFELLRLLAATFIDLDPCVKIHTVHFVTKILVQYRQLNSSDISTLSEYILSLSKVDSNHDVRDRARHESNLLMCLGLTLDNESSDFAGQGTVPLHIAEAMLLGTKPAPSWLPIDAKVDELPHVFRFGTLSNMVSHKAGSTYMQLPSWSDTDSPSALRDPPQQTNLRDPTVQQNIDKGEVKYSSSDTEDDSSGDSSDESSVDESSSEGDSSSDEDSTNSSYETSSDVDSSASSEDDEPIDNRTNKMKSYSKLSVDHFDILQGDEPLVTATSASPFDIGVGRSIPSSGAEIVAAKETNLQKRTSIGELDGLVMPPFTLQSSIHNTNSTIDSNIWIPLLRYEIAGGLSVMIRSMRGLNRDRAIKLALLTVDNPAVLCFELKLENKRTDDGLIRRIRLGARSSLAGYLVKQVLFPQEVPILRAGEMTIISLIAEYNLISTKDGAMIMKLELKSDKGSFPLEINPPLGELITPFRIADIEFDSACQRFHSVHHKSSAKLSSTPLSEIQLKTLPISIISVANMYFVNEESFTNDRKMIKMASLNPENNSQIFLTVDIDLDRIILCCEDTMLLNALMALVKKALMTSTP